MGIMEHKMQTNTMGNLKGLGRVSGLGGAASLEHSKVYAWSSKAWKIVKVQARILRCILQNPA